MGTSQVMAMNDVLTAANTQPRWNANPPAERDSGFDRLLEQRGTAREDAPAQPAPRRPAVDASDVKQRRDGQGGKTQRQKSATRADPANADTGQVENPAEVEPGEFRAAGSGTTGKGTVPAPGQEMQEKGEVDAVTALQDENNQAVLASIGTAEAPAEVSQAGSSDPSTAEIEALTVAQVETADPAESEQASPETTATTIPGEPGAAAANAPQQKQAEQDAGADDNAEPVHAPPHGDSPGRDIASTHGAAKEEPPGLARAAAVIAENRERQSLKRAETGKQEQQNPAQEGGGAAEGGESIPDDGRLKIEVKKEAQPRPVVLQTGENAQAAVSEPSTEEKGPQQPEHRDGKLEVSGNEEIAEQKVAATDLPVEKISGSEDAAAANAARKGVRQETGGEASGDAAGRDHQEAKAQTKVEGEVPATAFANQTAAVERTAPESRSDSSRSALHQNILSQIKGGVVSHDGKGNGQMSIRLKPDELGELQIQVRMEDNRLRVEVQAENRAVKDLLMSNLDSLKEALSGKNVAMDGFNVSTGGGFDNPLTEQRESGRQPAQRMARSGYRDERAEGRVVNYLTAEVNTLLDVRF